MLCKHCHASQKDWDGGVPSVLCATRETVQELLGLIPAELVFGHEVKGPLKVLKEHLVIPGRRVKYSRVCHQAKKKSSSLARTKFWFFCQHVILLSLLNFLVLVLLKRNQLCYPNPWPQARDHVCLMLFHHRLLSKLMTLSWLSLYHSTSMPIGLVQLRGKSWRKRLNILCKMDLWCQVLVDGEGLMEVHGSVLTSAKWML